MLQFLSFLPKNLQNIVGCTVLVLLTVSCYLDPDEKYQVDLVRPDPSSIGIDINIVSDTIFLIENFSPLSIFIKLSDNTIKVDEINFYIDNGEVSYSSSNDYYGLNAELKAGKHSLRVEVITKTGSNSLAEKIGAEKFVFSTKDIVLIVMPRDKITNISAIESELGLTLNWKSGFAWKNFRIVKNFMYQGYDGYGIGDTVFYSPTLSFIDENYIGEAARYTVYGLRINGGEQKIGELFLPSRLPKVRFIQKQTKLALTWPRSIYYQKMEKIIINNLTLNENNRVRTLANTDTIVYLEQAYFGKYVPFEITFIPKNNFNSKLKPAYQYFYNKEIRIPGPDPYRIMASSCNEVYYSNYDSFYRYDIEKETITMRMAYWNEVATSPDGKYLLIRKDNTVNLYTTRPISLLRTIDAGTYYNSAYRISNNGVGMFTTKPLHIIDFKENAFNISSDVYSLFNNYNAWISPDGNYLMAIQNMIYQGSTRKVIFARIVSPNIIPLDTFHITYDEKIGFMEETDRFFLFTNRTLYIKKFSDFSTVKSIPTIHSVMGNIDACSNRMITRGQDGYHIYDLASGQIVVTLPPQHDDNFFLSNGVVFFRDGSNYYLNR